MNEFSKEKSNHMFRAELHSARDKNTYIYSKKDSPLILKLFWKAESKSRKTVAGK